jgi:hypothetical protein
MKVRTGTLADEDAIKELFKKQGLQVSLPLASSDPAVAFTLVADDGERVRTVLIGRLGLEIHLVADPTASETVRDVRAIAPIAEGFAMKLSYDLVRHGWPAITDAEAWVPKGFERMPELMKLVGFEPSPDAEFEHYYKVLGKR